ncbi:MAG: hypothetical protein KDJ65_18555 [Anaerolineae bacterium]|nr:hypothetical protein [Anaerolineae bacterium]
MNTLSAKPSKPSQSFDLASTNNLLVVILFIAIFTMAVRVPADTDTWWHLSSGQYIVDNLTIPTTDPFSHTKFGETWIDHGWLAQIFWYGLYAAGGWALVSLALASLVTASFWFIWKQIEANVFIAALSMVLGAIVSSIVWAARPQMVTFLLVAITSYLLDRYKRHDGRLLPWLPLIMILWVNVHGGYAIGFMLMVAYVLGEVVNVVTGHREDPVISWSRLKHLLLVMAVCLAVVVINPHTWRMWVYPFQTVGIGALRDFIQEWQSPNFHLPYVQPFAVMLLLIMAAMGRSGRQTDWTDLALVAMWTLWALFAGRNIAIFGLVTTPVLARYADVAWTRQWNTWGYERVPFATTTVPIKSGRQPKLVLNSVLLGVIVIAALIKIAVPLTPNANLKAEKDSLPYEAINFIRDEQPPAPIFNSYNWGGYFIFKLWPDYQAYIDGRTDLYDDAFIRRYLDVITVGDDWQKTLDEDGINTILIEHNGTLDKFLRIEPGWAEIYRDDMAVVFTRRASQP